MIAWTYQGREPMGEHERELLNTDRRVSELRTTLQDIRALLNAGDVPPETQRSAILMLIDQADVQPRQFGRVWWVDSDTTAVKLGRFPVLADSAADAVRDFQRGFDTGEIPKVTPGDWAAVANLAYRGYETVNPYEWEPHPDEPGCIRVRRAKTLEEVAGELRVYLGPEHENTVESPLHPYVLSGDRTWPLPHEIGRLMVFAVRGGNEGAWVYVEWLDRDGKAECLLLSKLDGSGDREESWRLAKRVADLLGV